jgi:hypothetical protein
MSIKTKLFAFFGLLAVVGVLATSWQNITSLAAPEQPTPTADTLTVAAGEVEVVTPLPEAPEQVRNIIEADPDVVPFDDGGDVDTPDLVVEHPVSVAAHQGKAAVAAGWVGEAFTWLPTDLGDTVWGPGLFDSPWDAAVTRANDKYGFALGMTDQDTNLIRVTSDMALRAGLTTKFEVWDNTDLTAVDEAWGHVLLGVKVTFDGEPTDGIGSPGAMWAPLYADLLFEVKDGKIMNAIVWGNLERRPLS